MWKKRERDLCGPWTHTKRINWNRTVNVEWHLPCKKDNSSEYRLKAKKVLQPEANCFEIQKAKVLIFEIMDSDDDTFDNVDSGNASSGEDDFPIVDEGEMSSKDRQSEHEEYPYEGLTTEEIVQHMVDCIKEVNTVVEVS